MFRRPPTSLVLQKEDVEELKSERLASQSTAKPDSTAAQGQAATSIPSASTSNQQPHPQHQADLDQAQRLQATRNQRLGL